MCPENQLGWAVPWAPAAVTGSREEQTGGRSAPPARRGFSTWPGGPGPGILASRCRARAWKGAWPVACGVGAWPLQSRATLPLELSGCVRSHCTELGLARSGSPASEHRSRPPAAGRGSPGPRKEPSEIWEFFWQPQPPGTWVASDPLTHKTQAMFNSVTGRGGREWW